MADRYIAFDVETPNFSNDRMSAIGITVVEDRMIREQFYSLVNPETHFDRFNIALTHITPDAVRNAPTFPELWEKIEQPMRSGILAAHNAPFDLSVLSKCLRDYGIRWKSCATYLCTCRAGRRLLPHLPDHKLNTLCSWYGIDLNHHHAGSDSQACAELLLNYLKDGMDPEPFVRTYDLAHMCTARRRV